MVVLCPGDAWEVRASMRAALAQDRPVYIRMGKRGEPKVHAGVPEDFRIGRALVISEGSDVCLLSTGTMLPEVIETARLLGARGVSAQVVSFHTVKPLDTAFLREAVARFRLVATIEEHSLIGGFGAAAAEWMIDNAVVPRKFLRFGTPDRFFKQSGEQEYAREQLGLSAHSIAGRVMAAWS
jgi:transketolase